MPVAGPMSDNCVETCSFENAVHSKPGLYTCTCVHVVQVKWVLINFSSNKKKHSNSVYLIAILQNHHKLTPVMTEHVQPLSERVLCY